VAHNGKHGGWAEIDPIDNGGTVKGTGAAGLVMVGHRQEVVALRCPKATIVMKLAVAFGANLGLAAR
jgi:hypothetical protein